MRKRQAGAVSEAHAADIGIDAHRPRPVQQGNPAVAPPTLRLELDIAARHFLRQHRGQQHAVVGEMRLVTDHGNRIAAERALAQFLDQPRRGHAIANDDERFAHAGALAP